MAAAIGYFRGMFQWTVKAKASSLRTSGRRPRNRWRLGPSAYLRDVRGYGAGALLMGFDPNTAIFFSGIGTLIFFVCVRGRVPSYLGSSFSFIAVVVSAEAIAGPAPTRTSPAALGGIIVCGPSTR